MAMLAEPRRRKRYNLCPRGKPLYEDDSRFGTKMLEKMGWTKGRGLGANEDGAQEFVRLRFKNDCGGLGYGERDDQWTIHDDSFNGLLKSLHGGEENGNASESEDARPMGLGFKADVTAAEEPEPKKLKEKLTGISLEEKSKRSKARVHYKKFTRGKDLAQYSEKDLANIFGKKAADETEIPAQIKKQEEVTEEKPVNPNFAGVCTISTGLSVNDYFKQKMEAMKQKMAQNKNVENTSMNAANEIANGDENVEEPPIKKKKNVENTSMNGANETANGDENVEEAPIKKKKKKKDKSREKEQETVETEVPAEAVAEEPSKKKKKSKRAAEENAKAEKEEPETEASSEPKRKKKKKDKKENEAPCEVAPAEEEPKKKKKKSKRNEDINVEAEFSEKPAKKKSKKNIEELTEEPKLTEPVPENREDSKTEDKEENEFELKEETPQEKIEKRAKKKSKKSKKGDKEEPQLQDETKSQTKSMTSDAPNGDDLATTPRELQEPANETQTETEVSEEESDKSGVRYLSMSHLLKMQKSFNVFEISSFCAEKFHILDMGAFKDSSLSEIVGYSLNENIELQVKEMHTDAMRIMSLWEGRRSKYSQKSDVERTRIMVKKLKYKRITGSHLKKLNNCNAFSGL
ncbi:uncharacterized protein Dmoj_GI19854, isoform C [Drosophila mojavensis]|uniref:Uncharacterized protein, isoform C n=1 Tax=Drosophila mojavensis TaxID=7230 RepID=B4KR51_DROMO|nr:uncharacterized protein Dmoj_GI19854, isoform C [Drosophila mojavensis]